MADEQSDAPEVTPAEEAAPQAPDLVEAMTRGLGLDKSIKSEAGPAAQPKHAVPTDQRRTGPRAKPKRRSTRHGRVALRKNPY